MSTVLSWTNDDGSIEVLELDIYTTETHDMPCEVSDSPVEQGPDISDNVRRLPKQLTLEGYVSDCPIPQTDLDRVARGTDLPGGTPVKGQHSLNVPGTPTFETKTVPLDVPDPPLRANLAALVTVGFNALAGALGLKTGPQATVNQRVADQHYAVRATTWTYQGWTSHVQTIFRSLERARDNAVLMSVQTDFARYRDMVITNLSVPRTVDDGEGASFRITLRSILIVNSKSVTAPKPAETLGKPRKPIGSKTTAEEPEETREAKRKHMKSVARAMAT